ncbi:MAG: exosortase/archaeosortase family protein [Planctomycetota bacterium]
MTAIGTAPAEHDRPAEPRRGRTVAWLAALLPLAVLAALPAWHNIAGLATRSAEYSHMLLVPPLAVFLLWQRRSRLAAAPVRASMLGVAMAALGVAMDFAGFASQIDLLSHLGMVMLLVAPVVAVLGWRWPLAALPAFGVLLFLIPVPGRLRQQIALPLQDASAGITRVLLDIFGVPVTQAGNVLQINGVDVAVAEACNGMRMVLALALVAYAFVFTVNLRPWAKIAVLAASPLIAVVVNVVRLVPTTLFYGYADRDVADAAHDISGWLVLGVALGILWTLLALARWLELPIENRASHSTEPRSPATR